MLPILRGADEQLVHNPRKSKQSTSVSPFLISFMRNVSIVPRSSFNRRLPPYLARTLRKCRYDGQSTVLSVSYSSTSRTSPLKVLLIRLS
ncbi:MAG: hypothetical protein ACTS5P_00980 [Candidatus Hodgkinia cicadicola]